MKLASGPRYSNTALRRATLLPFCPPWQLVPTLNATSESEHSSKRLRCYEPYPALQNTR